MAGNIISTDTSSSDTYKHSGFTTTISDSFGWTGGSSNRGATWDGTNLIHSNLSSGVDRIEKYSGFSSTITSTFASPSTAPEGCAWDGTNILSIDGGSNDKMYLHAGFTTTISDSFSSPSSSPGRGGIGWDGTDTLSSDNSSDLIYKHSGFSNSISDTFSSPSSGPNSSSYDSDNVLSSDFSSDVIYQHSGFSSTVLDSFSSPGSGLAGVADDSWSGGGAEPPAGPSIISWKTLLGVGHA